MATRKHKAPKAKAPTRSDREIREEQHDEAVRVLRAEYYQAVRSLVAELKAALDEGEIRDQDGWQQRIDETLDSSYWVIYTHANKQVVFVSDNADAYFDEGFGPMDASEGIDWAALAVCALRADVQELISAEGIEPEWDGSFAENSTLETAAGYDSSGGRPLLWR